MKPAVPGRLSDVLALVTHERREKGGASTESPAGSRGMNHAIPLGGTLRYALSRSFSR